VEEICDTCEVLVGTGNEERRGKNKQTSATNSGLHVCVHSESIQLWDLGGAGRGGAGYGHQSVASTSGLRGPRLTDFLDGLHSCPPETGLVSATQEPNIQEDFRRRATPPRQQRMEETGRR